MEQQTHKLQVKIGDAEFSAEGAESTVKEQFTAFLEAVRGSPVADRKRAETPVPPTLRELELGGDETLDDSRVFSVDGDNMVSLKVLPKTDTKEADALLVLLFGFRTKLNQTEVNAGRLTVAAKHSGFKVERVDRTMLVHRSLVNAGGHRRGKRYGLNNQGMARAREIIQSML